jgi:LysR family transcriptional activator of dmlA
MGAPGDVGVYRGRLVGAVSLMASPAYLARAGTPTSVEDLSRHELLRGHDGRFPVDGGLVTNDHSLLLAAAVAGLGVALMSELTCQAALARGELVRVLPEVGQRAVLRVIVAHRSGMPAPVRVFVDAVHAHFRG